MNPTQKVPTFKAGQALTADSLNHAVRALLGMIVPGRGILVKPMGNKIEISAEGGPIPRTGGGGTETIWYVEATKEELPNTDIPETALGRAAGNVYVRNPANNGWDAITRLE